MRKTSTIHILSLFALLVVAGWSPAGESGRRVTADTKWLCYYGDDRRVLDVDGYQLLILESEAIGDVSDEDKAGRLCVAYMSVGEAEQNRWFWRDIKDRQWVLDVNPDWPDARRVDPRSVEWQRLLIDEVAANILAAGYDGFLLDNVDTPEFLMRTEPELYKGAEDAMAGIIRGLRERYPGAVIIANGGLGVVPGVAGSLDAMMYEGTVSSWRRLDNGTFAYGEIAPKQKTWLRPRLARVKSAGLPVLALEYANPGDPAGMKKVWEEVVKAGNNPYISQRDLDTFPGSDKLPPLPEEE